ncbi:conserved Plasmodium protein, unknown function [Plasmodium sp. gorilla clade G2]|uniref:conserved Plasmodium protein, unknown function n=1 Tax=Plasmodium sp. gorilla clade G2 TaxID=880535 RepID=UPI000D22080A|nr:conserved Plasmodium protein, unknown function [Plasmodium sp. gorilla clade G2]SOV15174.1 conserved Plasmodium protein, unknown function [Plasmodium sp. gorilla clade G2]
MDDYLNEDADIKHRAWLLHFQQKKNNYKFNLTKKKNKKYIIKWIKVKDEESILYKWTQKKILNEKYNSEDDKDEKINDDDMKVHTNVDVTNPSRRSYRLNLQQFLNNNLSKKNYIDPTSEDSSNSENEV